MKQTIKILSVVILISLAILSCRDTKKEEEQQVEQAVERIDSVESELEKAAKKLDEKINHVEEALKDLDSI